MQTKIIKWHFAFFVVLLAFANGHCQQSTANLFYTAYSSASLHSINGALYKIETFNTQKAEVYSAVLKIKKAEFISGISKKLQLFNAGKGVLEKAIKKNSKNIEWRFLRLSVQQNTPSILGYDDKISQDLKFIYTNFGSANEFLRKKILDYAKNTGLIDTQRLI